MSILAIDMAAATAPPSMDAITQLCTETDAQNVSVWMPAKIAMGAGPRSAADLDLEDVVASVVQLAGAGDAPDPPKVFTIGMNARGEGGSVATVELRQKRALCQSLVEYLWRCTGHGGLKTGSGFLILPSAFPPIPPVSSGVGGGAAGPGLPPQAPGLGGAAGGPSDPAEVGSADGGGSAAAQGSRKRTLAELHAAVDELSERQSLAEGLGQPAERDAVATPPARRPMTYVSIPDKVRFYVCLALCIRTTHSTIARSLVHPSLLCSFSSVTFTLTSFCYALFGYRKKQSSGMF